MCSSENKDKKKVIECFSSKKNKYYYVGTYLVIHLIVFIFAIYLSFKCHGGFEIISFLVAFFCPWIYVIYALVFKWNKCFKNQNS